MKRNLRPLLAGSLVLMFALLACKISLPSKDQINNAATAVSGTVTALAQLAQSQVTESPSNNLPTVSLPTVSLPSAEPLPVVYPLQVSFATSDGDLYTWNESMSAPLQLLDTNDVCCSYVSPDGSMVAYTRFDNYNILELGVINADGSNRRVLLDGAGFDSLPHPAEAIETQPDMIRWVPNSHTLAMSIISYFEGPGSEIGSSLYLFDCDTGAMTSILSVESPWRFFISPDGSKIAVTRPTGIDIYAINGSLIADNVLVYEFVNTATESAWVAWPKWSLDSTSLIVDVPPVEPFPYGGGTVDNTTIWKVAADGMSGEMTLGVPMSYYPSGSVDFSNDLHTMLYLTSAGATDSTLKITDVYGGYSIDYATGNFMVLPSWSPDDSHFFYAIGDGLNNTPYIGMKDSIPSAASDYNNADSVKWIDDNRYIVSVNNDWHWRLLLGTIGAPTGLIFDSPAVIEQSYLSFSINR